jgi:hypothetical protein
MRERMFKKIDIKRAVSAGRRVRFIYYLDGSLWYETEFDEKFDVPIADIGNATFSAEDKALLFMRYMRKWNQKMEENND